MAKVGDLSKSWGTWQKTQCIVQVGLVGEHAKLRTHRVLHLSCCCSFIPLPCSKSHIISRRFSFPQALALRLCSIEPERACWRWVANISGSASRGCWHWVIVWSWSSKIKEQWQRIRKGVWAMREKIVLIGRSSKKRRKGWESSTRRFPELAPADNLGASPLPTEEFRSDSVLVIGRWFSSYTPWPPWPPWRCASAYITHLLSPIPLCVIRFSIWWMWWRDSFPCRAMEFRLMLCILHIYVHLVLIALDF